MSAAHGPAVLLMTRSSLHERPRAIEAGACSQALRVASFQRALNAWQGHGAV